MAPFSPAERLLDLAIECTFPASDPIAVTHAFHAADRAARPHPEREPIPEENDDDAARTP